MTQPTNLQMALRRQEVAMAGYQAREYVRGALDPLYASPVARDARVQWLLGPTHRNMAWYSIQEAAGLAAAFLRGWTTHRG